MAVTYLVTSIAAVESLGLKYPEVATSPRVILTVSGVYGDFFHLFVVINENGTCQRTHLKDISIGPHPKSFVEYFPAVDMSAIYGL